jgi:hypothetical protein
MKRIRDRPQTSIPGAPSRGYPKARSSPKWRPLRWPWALPFLAFAQGPPDVAARTLRGSAHTRPRPEDSPGRGQAREHRADDRNLLAPAGSYSGEAVGGLDEALRGDGCSKRDPDE